MTEIEGIESILSKILFLLIVIAILIVFGSLTHNSMLPSNLKATNF